ncbi:SseB family protein [Citreicella sp. C3M06]|uniref:SseB family protein n=1 Tax=Roseobacteraceae TaxID=2854170 RepID=UPI001C099F1A|nr:MULTISPECIES: SseB family protein [Roseobacteraceae]MBU2959742.1 SseB family protein [Citreicella sp. C3M06]MDO6584203.1 SseB family protein [Salipiger sp. 1_MG-2023]
MTLETPLDHAHAAMEAAPLDGAARLRFYERLADGELFVLLAKEATGDTVEPEVFELADASFVLVFDREERLSQFVGAAAPYAALSGRACASMLAGQGIGLAVNLEVAPSSILLPPEAVDWLNETLGHGPAETHGQIEEVTPPGGLPESLITALDTKLATAVGLARAAWLAGVRYEDGTRSHLLAFAGAVPGAEDALARAVNEALVFSGIEAGSLDVTFVRDHDPLAASLTRVGLRFDLPEPEKPARIEPIAPGSDPDSPPILR